MTPPLMPCSLGRAAAFSIPGRVSEEWCCRELCMDCVWSVAVMPCWVHGHWILFTAVWVSSIHSHHLHLSCITAVHFVLWGCNDYGIQYNTWNYKWHSKSQWGVLALVSMHVWVQLSVSPFSLRYVHWLVSPSTAPWDRGSSPESAQYSSDPVTHSASRLTLCWWLVPSHLHCKASAFKKSWQMAVWWCIVKWWAVKLCDGHAACRATSVRLTAADNQMWHSASCG